MKLPIGGLGIGHAMMAIGLLALGVAALIFLLGTRGADEVLRLAAEGRVVQGQEVSRHYDDDSFTRTVAYVVAGRRYTATVTASSTGSRPVFDEEPIAVAGLEPANPDQVVYLPSDPSISRLRFDMKEARGSLYFATGFFALIGLGFIGIGYVFRKPF